MSDLIDAIPITAEEWDRMQAVLSAMRPGIVRGESDDD